MRIEILSKKYLWDDINMNKFFETTIEIKVLSENEPIEFIDLEQLNYLITYGSHSGEIKIKDRNIS